MKTWRRLAAYLLVYRGALAVAVVSMLLLALTTGLYPVLLDILTTFLVAGGGSANQAVAALADRVKPLAHFLGFTPDVEALGAMVQRHLLLLFAGVVLVKAMSQALRFYSMGWIAQRVVNDIRQSLFERILRQGRRFFGEHGSGGLVSRLMNDVAQVERAATYAIPVILGDVMKVLSLGTVCIIQYPKLSLVSLGVLPLAVLPIVKFGRMLKRYARDGQQALGALTNRITETLGGVDVIQTYGQEAYEARRFERDSQSYIQLMLKSVFVRAVQTPAMELVGVAALLLTIGYAVGRVNTGDLRPGEVVGFLLALVLLYEPLKSIGRLNGIVVPGLASAERVFEIVDREPDVQDRSDARQVVLPVRTLAFEAVWFRYRDDGPWVLEDVDLELKPGSITALVGSSGAGKSTIAALVPRLFDVSRGVIRLDGIDIRTLSLKALRAQIAIVAQETYLFNDSIRENIAYGDPEASEEAIIEAAKRAYAHDFISAMPEGYATRAGERGARLSGGQRQRIAIARAFLRRAPILILDEATSALDAESEREVQNALDALMKDRATLVIAHRLSTIRAATEILVLSDGRVVERGSHAELMQRDDTYARLVGANRRDVTNDGRPEL
ncbi:MAG: ABC transporter ATP-binding protein [Deltaproteobacteria bacterium]|nr:ABC transporter ATP-binding protein [Deltaproteobacteria bacterium]